MSFNLLREKLKTWKSYMDKKIWTSTRWFQNDTLLKTKQNEPNASARRLGKTIFLLEFGARLVLGSFFLNPTVWSQTGTTNFESAPSTSIIIGPQGKVMKPGSKIPLLYTLPETNSKSPWKSPCFLGFHTIKMGGFSSQRTVSLQECKWGDKTVTHLCSAIYRGPTTPLITIGSGPILYQ